MCGRNQQEDVALSILKGDRSESLDLLEVITKDHKRYLAQCIQEIGEKNKIIELKNIQYFDGEDIKPNVVGTIAGMILSQRKLEKTNYWFYKN